MSDLDPPPPPPDDNLAPTHAAIVIPLFAVAVLVWSVRIYTRLWPRFTMTAADYLITIAMACKTVSLAFYLVAMSHGFGRHSHYVSAHDAFMINRYLLGVYMAGVVVSASARISIAVLLLRFTTARAWRGAIWAVVGAQVGYVVVYEIVQLVQCQSVLVGASNTRCMSRAMVLTSTYALMGMSLRPNLLCVKRMMADFVMGQASPSSATSSARPCPCSWCGACRGPSSKRRSSSSSWRRVCSPRLAAGPRSITWPSMTFGPTTCSGRLRRSCCGVAWRRSSSSLPLVCPCSRARSSDCWGRSGCRCLARR